MPAKNTKYLTGKRNLIVDKKFYKRFIEETKLDMDYQTFKDIILESNKEIANIISDSDDAFKLPENLGYIAVTKYKSKKQPIDWVNTNRLKRKIPLLNLHSFNYIYHIKWFKRSQSDFGIKKVYKLEPTRLLKRTVAHNIKNGKTYHDWQQTDFWNINKVVKKLTKTED